MSTSNTSLWPHQHRAVAASVDTLARLPRATVVAACGAGKTRTGAEIARRTLTHDDSTLLMVAPTLDLVSQTLREYLDHLGADRVGTLIAVCSDQNAVTRARLDFADTRLDAEVTTSPALLGVLLRRPGRRTVVCTYQSLHVLERLHATHATPPWDLAVIDEAHRTAGVTGRPWSSINDDAHIPCRRRLYMTATPRVFERDDVVSMDDEKVYGPVCDRFGFADAINAGVLVDYQLIVPVIADPDVLALTSRPDGSAPFLSADGGTALSARMLAVQLAVLRAAHQHGVSRLVTFHNRVADARGFADSISRTAQLLAAGERPWPIDAIHLSGRHPIAVRHAALGLLASPDPGLVVLSNCHMLAEGVNVPGIDAVAFIDPRTSAESIVQGVGRALRSTGRPGEIATVIVPVLLAPGQNPHSALDGSEFAPVWHAVRALCTHDERLAENLNHLRYLVGRSAYVSGHDTPQLPAWMKVTGLPVPDRFAESVALHVVRAASSSWEEMFGQCAAYRERHGHLTPSLHEDRRLHTWLTNQRALRNSGRLAHARIERLNEIAMPWSVHDERFTRGVEALRDHRREHGHLRVPKTATFGTPPMSLHTLLHRLRGQYKRGELSSEARAVLEELGIDQDSQDGIWLAAFSALRQFHAAHGHVEVPLTLYWGDPPFALGRWWNKQRAIYVQGRMRADRAHLLADLKVHGTAHEVRWDRAFAAAARFHQEHGHLRVPADTTISVDGVGINLDAWIRRQRARRARGELSQDRADRLDNLEGASANAEEG